MTGVAPWSCPSCGSPLELALPPPDPDTFAAEGTQGVWRYLGWLPPGDPVTLGEPTTALVGLPSDGPRVFVKLEGGQPTGSFKDRGASATIASLRSRGVREIVVDSSGNAGASFAAYAARAGITARVFVPTDASAAKLLQVRAHGAIVETVPGPRAAAGEAARAALDATGPDVAYASHLWQPAFLAGTATFAYEVVEQLGGAPDTLIAPLGGGTLLLGAALGFERLRDAGLIASAPRLVGVQSAACAPLASAFHAGRNDADPVEPGMTIAEGIRIARPPRSRQIIASIRASGGTIVEVSDEEIVASLRRLLTAGLFVEPTSAAAHAGLAKVAQPDETVVLALTGHGLKAVAALSELLPV